MALAGTRGNRGCARLDRARRRPACYWTPRGGPGARRIHPGLPLADRQVDVRPARATTSEVAVRGTRTSRSRSTSSQTSSRLPANSTTCSSSDFSFGDSSARAVSRLCASTGRGRSSRCASCSESRDDELKSASGGAAPRAIHRRAARAAAGFERTRTQLEIRWDRITGESCGTRGRDGCSARA